MANELSLTPMSNLIFDESEIFIPTNDKLKNVESKSDKNLSNTSKISLYCQELGNALVFAKTRMARSDDILLELPVPDIISAEKINEKKRIGQKWFCTIKTTGDTISIQADEYVVDAFVDCINGVKVKEELMKQSTDITIIQNGSPKTISINPYSPSKHNGEDIIEALSLDGAVYCIVTNYRAYFNALYNGNTPGYEPIKSLTHADYDTVLTSNVEKKTETDSVGGVEERSSMWNLVQNQVDISYNEERHHSSSVETETGNIEFMKEGRQAMIWKNIADPVALVEKIKAVKSSFSTGGSTPQSVDDDPIKALKMRFVKGEISKEEFEEMKSMLE